MWVIHRWTFTRTRIYAGPCRKPNNSLTIFLWPEGAIILNRFDPLMLKSIWFHQEVSILNLSGFILERYANLWGRNFSIFKVNCFNNHSICRKFFTCRLLGDRKNPQWKYEFLIIFVFLKNHTKTLKKLNFKAGIARQKFMWYKLSTFLHHVAGLQMYILLTVPSGNKYRVILSWK